MAYNYKAKTKNVNQLNNYMLAKTLSMFSYENLPETIPAKELEKIIQKNGYAYITEVNGKLYALSGTVGGEVDAYGNPQTITVNNIFLNYNKTLDIEKDGVLISNDDLSIGLMPLFEKQNTFLVENEINMMIWGYNSRTQKLISAPDDRTRESAERYLTKIVDGDLSVVGENALFDGIKIQGGTNSNGITVGQMVEFQQYIKSTLYNEVGLSSNFNMKRERLVSGEVDTQEDSLFPLVYNMLKCRMEAVEKINEKYDLNISVDFGSVWKLKQVELEQELEANEQNSNQDVNQNRSTDSSDGSEQAPEVDEAGEREREGERSEAPAPDPVTDTLPAVEQATEDFIEELNDIVNSEESTDDDKEAAKELINEISGDKDND